MSKLKALRNAVTKPELAYVLGVSPIFLTRCLYVIKPENQYHNFEIAKRSGGHRVINAPSDDLKSLQKHLSNLLLDCVDEITNLKYPDSQQAKPKRRTNTDLDMVPKILKIKIPSAMIKQPSLSHGFVRNRSIITNAMMHIGKKNVLNIDLKDFFEQFNFGRVRGFFIKNENFKLDPSVATVIAQIACYENKLPQGSPCSPVIANLITHSLDIRLAALAKKHKCTYTRYADDITFSTRLNIFPSEIMCDGPDGYIAGKDLRQEIERSGFSINKNKTRIQYKNSRQEVTGLVVNKKPSVKSEYCRLVRAKCNSLFKTGKFSAVVNGKEIDGNINELEGQLNFIDQIDYYNRTRQKKPLVAEYEIRSVGKATKTLLSGREKTFSQFLFYKYFWGNLKPTILCEGKTDNVYLKSAINGQFLFYPLLAQNDGNANYKLLVNFIEYSKRTRFLLEIFGGYDYLIGFINGYEKNSKLYSNVKPSNPVIVILDNDSGGAKVAALLKSDKFSKKINPFHSDLSISSDIRDADYIHVFENLYVMFTPRPNGIADTDIEYFFDDKTRLIKHPNGKCFNTVANRDEKNDLSKDAFANNIVKEHKSKIDFNGFNPLLDRMVQIITNYNKLKGDGES